MRNSKTICLFFFITFFVQSCGTISTWVHGEAYSKDTKHTLPNTVEMLDSSETKSIVLVPSVHVGSKEDYEKIAFFLDGLKSNGYVIFHEGMYLPGNVDSLLQDTLVRKYRKMVGCNPSQMFAKKIIKHEGWISQSDVMLKEVMHVSTDKDICTDISLKEFIDCFENIYGPIILDDYDMTCPLKSREYKSRLPNASYAMNQAMLKLRDERLLDHVLNDGFDKIAVLYGSCHTCRLKFELLSRGFHFKY